MILLMYIENPKYATRKLLILEFINEFGKFAVYKINTQKYLEFIHTNKKDQKEKLRKQSHLSSHQKVARNKAT